MDLDPTELIPQQDGILTACNQPSLIQMAWSPGYRDAEGEANALRNEVCHSIEKYWSKHMRQLSRHINALSVELRTSIERMKATPDVWIQSQHSASGRVNASAEVLKMAVANFIDAISDISLDTLRIGRSRSSNAQETTADMEAELRLALQSVNNNVDLVTAQVDALTQATATYNFLNPATEVTQPNTGDQDTPRTPPAPRPVKFDPKESFLSNLRGRQFIDSSTSVINEEHLETLESYLMSGGIQGDTDIVERYAFQVMDSPSKEDYRVMKQKMLGEGEVVNGIEGVLQCIRRTICARRSL